MLLNKLIFSPSHFLGLVEISIFTEYFGERFLVSEILCALLNAKMDVVFINLTAGSLSIK